MDELKRAIEAAGSVSALARSLGISQSRVSNWLTRGSVPDGWLRVLKIQALGKIAEAPAANDPQAPQQAEQGAANA